MAQLGTLFAREGEVDRYFESGAYCPACKKWITHADANERCGNQLYWFHPVVVLKGDFFETPPSLEETQRVGEIMDKAVAEYRRNQSELQDVRVSARVAGHIRSAPEREAAALRTWWDGYKADHVLHFTLRDSALKDKMIRLHASEDE